MDFRPKQAITAFALAIAGGLLAMVAALYSFEGEELITIGVYLLTALVFFALAGAYSPNAQWRWEVASVVAVLLLVLVAGAALMGAISALPAAVFILILLPLIYLGMDDEVKFWLELDKL